MSLLLSSWDLRELRKLRFLEVGLNFSASQRISDFPQSLHFAMQTLMPDYHEYDYQTTSGTCQKCMLLNLSME